MSWFWRPIVGAQPFAEVVRCMSVSVCTLLWWDTFFFCANIVYLINEMPKGQRFRIQWRWSIDMPINTDKRSKYRNDHRGKTAAAAWITTANNGWWLKHICVEKLRSHSLFGRKSSEYGEFRWSNFIQLNVKNTVRSFLISINNERIVFDETTQHFCCLNEVLQEINWEKRNKIIKKDTKVWEKETIFQKNSQEIAIETGISQLNQYKSWKKQAKNVIKML